MVTEIEKNKKLIKIVLALSIICCLFLFALCIHVMSIQNEKLFNRESSSMQEDFLEAFIVTVCGMAIYLIVFLNVIVVKKLLHINKLLAAANIDNEEEIRLEEDN